MGLEQKAQMLRGSGSSFTVAGSWRSWVAAWARAATEERGRLWDIVSVFGLVCFYRDKTWVQLQRDSTLFRFVVVWVGG